MIGKSVVFNMKPVMYYRFIWGYRQNFQSSFTARFLSKAYPIVVLFIIFTYQYIFFSERPQMFRQYFYNGEFFIYTLISFKTKDEFIYSWFKYLHPIDSIPGAAKLYRKLEIFAKTTMMFSFAFTSCAVVYSYYSNYFTIGLAEYFLILFFLSNIDMGRFTISLCLSLLYCRTKVLKMALESDFSNHRYQNGFDVNRFKQMYAALEVNLREISRPMTLMTVIGVLFVISRTAFEISWHLVKIKQSGAGAVNLVDWFSLWIPVIYLAMAAMALDLTADNLKDIQAMCIEKRFCCTNERSRCEIQQLLQLLEHRPLCYTVWRARPLSMYLMLSFFSFCIINIIAILQIKSFYS